MNRAVVIGMSVVLATPAVMGMRTTAPPPAYTVVDLGTLGGSESIAYAINDAGQVAGYSTDAAGLRHGFFWSSAVGLVDIGHADDLGFGIDGNGRVVGSADPSTYPAGFWWTQGQGMHSIGTLGGTVEGHGYAADVTAGIVGSASLADNVRRHAYRFVGGVMTDLGTLGGPNSYALSLNHGGVVVGYSDTAAGPQHAVMWDASGRHDLGTLGPCGSAGEQSGAYGINDRGDVVGATSTAHLGRGCADSVAFLYSNGTMTQLPTLTVRSGTPFADAYAINHCRQAVGSSLNRAALWQGGTVSDLNSMIPSTSGWVLTHAYGINNTGAIVGMGSINRQTHAFVLLPKQPTTC